MHRQAEDASISIRGYFGSRLRHWRKRANLTQAGLARQLGYDQSHISKVESGERWPPPDLPGRADRLFDTGGELSQLWPLVERERQLALNLEPQRRHELVDSAGSTGGLLPSRWPGTGAVEALRHVLRAQRAAAETIGGRFMITMMEHYTRAIVQWQSTAPASATPNLLTLAAEYAEVAGWARFDNTDYSMALYWYTCGHQWARIGGDPHLASRLLARQSTVHWATGDAASAIALGSAARGVAGLAAGDLAWAGISEARGHAQAGDQDTCQRRLDEAARLVDSKEASTGQHCLESAGSVLSLAIGTCYQMLADRGARRGMGASAARHTQGALDAVPVHAAHDRALIATRLARAHVTAGEPDQAVAALASLPYEMAPHGSARILAELHDAHLRLVKHWPRLASVRSITEQLIGARLIPPVGVA